MSTTEEPFFILNNTLFSTPESRNLIYMEKQIQLNTPPLNVDWHAIGQFLGMLATFCFTLQFS